MVGSRNGRRWSSVDEVVEAYESAQERDGRAELSEFVPPADHPEYLTILCELVRVDLEYGWRRGRPSPLETYQERFPDLFRDAGRAQEITYEESRLRQQAEDPGSSARSRTRPEPGDGASEGFLSAALAYRAYRRVPSDDSAGLEGVFTSRRVPRESAELFRSLHAADPRAADRLAGVVGAMPAPGTDFLGFRLQSELGRGAFGRVYLARQGDLANRPVALKVSADVTGETRALAQLQHTNIVPIYSVHRAGPLQAVCMPYLGSTTLADVLSELRKHETLPDSGAGLLSSHRHRGQPTLPVSGGTDLAPAEGPPVAAPPTPDGRLTAHAEHLCGLGYVQAVLWLLSRLAEGLGHAHERGILHLDLKPANVLFSDDGEPLLLDFNLAADIKLPVQASVAMLGGTLPYMAPEHLDAFRDGSRAVDARSDLFSLGVILYELLTKRHPYEVRRGPVDLVLPQMVADRLGPPPAVRRWNRQVTPAAESIVRRCLEPDPARRYQSAHELREDLQRQLDDLPLKHAPEPSYRERLGKWVRRHPRLTSTTTVGVLSACLLAAVILGFLIRQHKLGQLEAADSFHRLTGEVAQAEFLLGSRDADSHQLDEGVALCQGVLGRYRILDDPSWPARPLAGLLPDADRDRLRHEVGDLLLLYARAVTWRAESTADPERRAKQIRFAFRLSTQAGSCFRDEEAPRALWLQRANLSRLAGRDDEARSLRERAEGIPLRTPRDRFWFVTDGLGRGERQNVLPTVQETTRLEPRNFTNWLLLGNCYAHLGQLGRGRILLRHGHRVSAGGSTGLISTGASSFWTSRSTRKRWPTSIRSSPSAPAWRKRTSTGRSPGWGWKTSRGPSPTSDWPWSSPARRLASCSSAPRRATGWATARARGATARKGCGGGPATSGAGSRGGSPNSPPIREAPSTIFKPP